MIPNMTKNKKIISLAVIVVAIIGLFIFVRQSALRGFFRGCCGFGTSTLLTEVRDSEVPLGYNDLTPDLPEIGVPLSNSPKDVAWRVFENYLAYNKAQDLPGVKRVVYRVAPVCAESATLDCIARMNQAYYYGSRLNRSDFIHVWSDERQIILSTDFTVQEDKNSLGRHRGIIYFINVDGDWKLLSFSPSKGGVVSKGSASMEELLDRIVRYTEDTDQDGTADYSEECLASNETDDCTKTNSRLRDTDSDGIWDGIEALM